MVVIVAEILLLYLAGKHQCPCPPPLLLASVGARSADASYQFQRASGKLNRAEQLLVKMIVAITQFRDRQQRTKVLLSPLVY